MGHWTLESVRHLTQTHDTSELFGNHYVVNFRLRYHTSAFGAYQETPLLYWHEVIMMNEHHKKQHWSFTTNMYEHNPLSKTLEVWAKRYLAAYDAAAGRPDAMMKGSCTLVDKNTRPVPVAALGAGLTDNNRKADAVRSYLKKNGGILFIEVDDIPSINIPKAGEHKERLLIFNCGIEGGGPRTQATQYLVVNAAQPKTNWTRQFNLNHSMTGLRTSGLAMVAAPALVSTPRTPIFGSGECW